MWQVSWHRKHSMHLRNSWTRSTSSWAMRQVPSGSGGRGLNGGIILLTRKFHDTSVTRSLMSGKACIGSRKMGLSVGTVSMRVMHMRRGLPLISAEHEPHLPALQFQRQARSGACVAWIWWTASRTTMPGVMSAVYSWKAPPFSSPRQILNVALNVASAMNSSPVPRSQALPGNASPPALPGARGRASRPGFPGGAWEPESIPQHLLQVRRHLRVLLAQHLLQLVGQRRHRHPLHLHPPIRPLAADHVHLR